MESELERGLFRWMLSHNLNFLIGFHNDVRDLLERAQGSSEDADQRHIDRGIQIYKQMNAANTLLLALGYLEEMLVLFWRHRLPTNPIPSGSIDRFKPLFTNLGLDLGGLRCWNVLKDAIVIRHCVLHANGRISLMRDPSIVESCIARHGPLLEKRNDRVAITSEFLGTSVQAISELRDMLLCAQNQCVETNDPPSPP